MKSKRFEVTCFPSSDCLFHIYINLTTLDCFQSQQEAKQTRMEVFGMSRSPDRSFDYLKDATTRGHSSNTGNNENNGNNPNESISFLLDTSAIPANETASIHETGSLASTKEQKKAFYTLHDTAVSEFLSPKKSPKGNDNTSNSNRYRSQLASPKARKGSLSPYSLPTLKATKEEQRKENTINQKTQLIPTLTLL